MLIRKKSQELAGKATVPDSVTSSCQINKYGTGLLLSLKKSSMFFLSLNKSLKKSSKNPAEQLDPHLTSRVETQSALSREKGINDWLNAGVDKPLEDLVGDTEQRYRSITVWVPHGLHWLWDCDYKRSFPDLENFESAQAGRKKVT